MNNLKSALILGISLFSVASAHSQGNETDKYLLDQIRQSGSVAIVDDNYAPCHFTVKVMKNEHYIVNSSPKDCGSVSKRTGRIQPDQMKIECPQGYYNLGRITGGPTGSYGDLVFYKAQTLCRYGLTIPLNEIP